MSDFDVPVIVGAVVVAVDWVIGAAVLAGAVACTAAWAGAVVAWAKAAIGRIARPEAINPLKATVRKRFMVVVLCTGRLFPAEEDMTTSL